MRYQEIENIEFTNSRGETKLLKNLRPLETIQNTFEMNNNLEFLDMISVRAYGNDAESLWYKIADQNIQKIVARKFNLPNIKIYEVPII